jgi:DNA-binding LytR/AlgR family response regulator
MKTINVLKKKTVNPKEVVMMKANVNYTEIYFDNGSRLIIAKTLKVMTSSFTEFGFFRINRSDTVNLKYIKHIDIDEMCLELINKTICKISRRRVEKFLDFRRWGKVS